jgi:hypothetical protein
VIEKLSQTGHTALSDCDGGDGRASCGSGVHVRDGGGAKSPM